MGLATALLCVSACERFERAQEALTEFELGPRDYEPAASRIAPRGPSPEHVPGAEREAALEPPRTGGARAGAVASAEHFSLRSLGLEPCEPPAGQEQDASEARIRIQVELLATGEPRVPANVFYATLEDSEGRRFEPELDGCKPLLQAEPLRAGQSARGYVTFVVPRSSTGLSLHYEPRLVDGTRDAIRLSLDGS